MHKELGDLTPARAQEIGELVHEAKVRERLRVEARQEVPTKLGEDEWEYISLRVGGLESLSAVMKMAQDRAEKMTRGAAKKRAIDWEDRLGGQIRKARAERSMSDEDFEAWARIKVEQMVSNPGPHTAGVLHSIKYLKKMREDRRDRDPEAIRRRLDENRKRLEELKSLERQAIEAGGMERAGV